MSREHGPLVEFRCLNDCDQFGCPGHVIREVFDRSTDTYSFEVDGKTYCVFDENMFAALLEAHRAARENKASPSQEVRNGG